MTQVQICLKSVVEKTSPDVGVKQVKEGQTACIRLALGGGQQLRVGVFVLANRDFSALQGDAGVDHPRLEVPHVELFIRDLGELLLLLLVGEVLVDRILLGLCQAHIDLGRPARAGPHKEIWGLGVKPLENLDGIRLVRREAQELPREGMQAQVVDDLYLELDRDPAHLQLQVTVPVVRVVKLHSKIDHEEI